MTPRERNLLLTLCTSVTAILGPRDLTPAEKTFYSREVTGAVEALMDERAEVQP